MSLYGYFRVKVYSYGCMDPLCDLGITTSFLSGLLHGVPSLY